MVADRLTISGGNAWVLLHRRTHHRTDGAQVGQRTSAGAEQVRGCPHRLPQEAEAAAAFIV